MSLLDEVLDKPSAPTVQTSGERSVRWYIRCRDCLVVSCIDAPVILPKGMPSSDRRRIVYATEPSGLCGICGGKVESMGYVGTNSAYVQKPILYTGTHTECKCNEKCANATGPNCDCQCDGANHGAGMAAFVTVDDYTAAPVYRPPTKSPEKAKARAEEYRAEREAAWNRIKASPMWDTYIRKCEGQYVANFSHYLTIRDAKQAVTEADRARTHAKRMKVLRSIMA